MRLLQAMFFVVTFALSFHTAFAALPRISCPGPPQFYSTLPYNFSIQINIPSADNKGPGEFYSIRLQYVSDTKFSYTGLVKEKSVGLVFQLINRQLIPAGGPTPARILDRLEDAPSAIIFNGGNSATKDWTVQAKLECTDKGKQLLTLLGDNCECL